jgi:hypothetical protein
MTKYEYKIATRNQYIVNQYDQCKTFDQNIFFISSGIFGLSFSFLENIVKNPQQNTKWIILLSWSLVLSSIVVSLSAYIINYYAYKKYIAIIDASITNATRILPIKESKNNSVFYAEIMNIINLALLILGMLFLMIYVGINFNGGQFNEIIK